MKFTVFLLHRVLSDSCVAVFVVHIAHSPHGFELFRIGGHRDRLSEFRGELFVHTRLLYMVLRAALRPIIFQFTDVGFLYLWRTRRPPRILHPRLNEECAWVANWPCACLTSHDVRGVRWTNVTYVSTSSYSHTKSDIRGAGKAAGSCKIYEASDFGSSSNHPYCCFITGFAKSIR